MAIRYNYILRIFTFIFICIFFISCAQNDEAESKSNVNVPGDTTSDNISESTDSMYLMHVVKKDSTYLFESPGLQSSKRQLLLKDEAIQEFKRKGDFVFGFYYSSPTDTVKGWALLSDFKVIRFNPPVIDSSNN